MKKTQKPSRKIDSKKTPAKTMAKPHLSSKISDMFHILKAPFFGAMAYFVFLFAPFALLGSFFSIVNSENITLLTLGWILTIFMLGLGAVVPPIIVVKLSASKKPVSFLFDFLLFHVFMILTMLVLAVGNGIDGYVAQIESSPLRVIPYTRSSFEFWVSTLVFLLAVQFKTHSLKSSQE